MSLFTPEPGLIIWMLIIFFLVVLTLGRYVWPSILKSIEERAEYIRQGVENAEEAARKLKDAETEGKTLIAHAHDEQIRLMNETEQLRNRLLEEARQEASSEKTRLMQQTQEAIAIARKEAMSEIRREVVSLSIRLSEKILREDLANKEAQEKLIEKMLSELKTNN